ncbi:MAG: hypothetical protein ACREIP_16840, partial [Alphaproteobacteria bacterium]
MLLSRDCSGQASQKSQEREAVCIARRGEIIFIRASWRRDWLVDGRRRQELGNGENRIVLDGFRDDIGEI